MKALQVEASGVVLLSRHDDIRISRIVRLTAHETLQLAKGQHDLFVLAGDGFVETRRLSLGGYLGCGGGATIEAGKRGITLFHFAHNGRTPSELTTISEEERVWRGSTTALISRSDFRDDLYRVALVAFHPGSKVIPHRHPHGEEIFVLSGSLHNAPRSIKPGDWHRLQPSEIHAPKADEETNIILLTGHLG